MQRNKLAASIFAVLAALSLTVAFVLPATAATGWVQVYEDANLHGDFLTKDQGNNVSNFGNLNGGLTPTCNKANGFASANWNDCVSSYQVRLAPHTCIAFYVNDNYNGAGNHDSDEHISNKTNSMQLYTVNLVWNNDAYTSMKWGSYSIPETDCNNI